MNAIKNGEIHLSEAPELRWFERMPELKCRCGKPATGILRGSRNESYGHHCQKCADKRLSAAAKTRERLAKMELKP